VIYLGLGAAVAGIGYTSGSGATDVYQASVTARQLFGLWALALLVASMLPGPLIFVLPWLPLKGHLTLGRRALGVSAFVLACSHVIAYLGPTTSRDWRDLYAPGPLWVSGLTLGLALFAAMTVLAFTSRDRAVRQLGPHRWKRWHRSVYVLLPLALLHATFVGADFGLNKGPDVRNAPDAGCLVAMCVACAAWLSLFLLRRFRIRWTPRLLRRRPAPVTTSLR
jgi:DMSO/TMAO reductase YedYZ heme-binding membrane subunit